jgi:uncharacterized membrane protein YraQ (UPF0718 family)
MCLKSAPLLWGKAWGWGRASIPELIILGSMFKKKLVSAFAVNVLFVAIAAGFLAEWLIYE